MGGLLRLLLGGAIGAAIGYLVFRKRLEKRDEITRHPAPPVIPAAPPAAAVPAAPPAIPTAPPAAPPGEALESPATPPAPEAPVMAVPIAEAAAPATLQVAPQAETEAWVEAEAVVVIDPAEKVEPVDFVLEHEDSVIGVAVLAEPDFPDFDEFKLEPITEPAPVETPAPAPVPGAETLTPAPPISAEALRARIEETRRRIRQEIEEPFMSSNPQTSWMTPAAAAPPEVRPLNLDPEPPTAPEDQEAPTAHEETIASLPKPAAGWEVAQTSAEDHAPARAEDEPELGVDYEGMKGRIEQTRSRLKAKAFDAMMSGESALLGRSSPDGSAERPSRPAFDRELEDTIDTGLREDK